MKAYKAFNKDMTCRGFQFEEGKEYEEQSAVLCKSGFHACENPLDCWNYYDMLNSDIHEVELDGVSDERNMDTKVCAKKIKIGVKMSLFDIVKASIDYVKESITKEDNRSDNVDFAQLANSGNWAKLANSGDSAKLANSGYSAQLANSGDSAKLANSGDSAQLANSGNWAQLANSGNRAQLANSGDCVTIRSTGKNSVLVCSGYHNKVSAMKGSWITLSEWKQDEEGHWIPVCVKTEQVDGVRIKENVLYSIKNGEFVEVGED